MPALFLNQNWPRASLTENLLPIRPTIPSKPVFTNTFEEAGTSAQNDVWYTLTNKGTAAFSTTHVLAGYTIAGDNNSTGQSLKITAGANQASQPLEIARKLTSGFSAVTSSFRLRYFVENDAGITDMRWRIYNDTTFTNGWQILNMPVKAGVWHDIEVTNSTFDLNKIGAPNWANPILSFVILANGVTGASNLPIIHFDFIEVVPTGATTGAIVMTLDDAFSAQVENALPYAMKAGIPVTVFVTINKISSGDPSYSTWARLKEFDRPDMIEWGMHFTGPTQSGFPYDSRPSGGVPSAGEKHAYMIGAKSAIANQQFLNYTPDLFALPTGTDGSSGFGYPTYNDFLIMKQHCSIVRLTKPFWSAADATARDGTAPSGVNDMGSVAYGYVPRYRRHTCFYPAATFGGDALYPASGHTAGHDLFTAAIDRIVANKDVLIDYEHNIGPGSVEVFSMLPVDWQSRIDYIRSKIDAGTLQALRFSDLVAGV